jgi:thiamine-monophosphate kinase
MACSPVGAVVSLLLPKTNSRQIGMDCMAGIIQLSQEFSCPIIGGDTNVGGDQLVISITAFGLPSVKGPLLRSSAKEGDWILVTGPLGGSFLGHHLNFMPKINEAQVLHQQYALNSGMDISDGLTLDLRRLADASNVGAELYLDKIPVSDSAIQRAEGSQQSPLDHALSDGEDFELLLTASESEAKRILSDQPLSTPMFHVGRITSGLDLIGVCSDGEQKKLEARGFQHGT